MRKRKQCNQPADRNAFTASSDIRTKQECQPPVITTVHHPENTNSPLCGLLSRHQNSRLPELCSVDSDPFHLDEGSCEQRATKNSLWLPAARPQRQPGLTAAPQRCRAEGIFQTSFPYKETSSGRDLLGYGTVYEATNVSEKRTASIIRVAGIAR
jgi:hypothetical protein